MSEPTARSRPGHGWWPYLLPYLGFLLAVEVGSRVPEAWSPWMLAVKPAVPALLIAIYARRGAYPELRGFDWKSGAVALDVVVGIALAAVWVVPYFLIAALPRPDEGFDAHQLGPDGVALVLGLRFIGYALVTPVFEELFIRSLVMRYADVFDTGQDFREVPIARYGLRSLLVTTVIFTLGHQPWEWWVAVPWFVLSSLWLYRRGHLMAVVVVHAATNAAILIAAATLPWDLWYFV